MSYMNPTALQEQLAAAHIEIESLEQQLADSRDNERNAQRELDNAKREIRGLRRSETARATSTGQIQQSSVDSGPLKEEIEALRTENENLKARIHSLLTPRSSTHTQGFSCLRPPQLPQNLSERSARSDEFGGQSFPGSPTPRLSESSLNTPRPVATRSFEVQSDNRAPQQPSTKKHVLTETPNAAKSRAGVGDTSSRSVEPASKETKLPQPPQGSSSKVVQEPLRFNTSVLEPLRSSVSTKSPTATDQRSFEEKVAEILANAEKERLYFDIEFSDSESEPPRWSTSSKSPAIMSRKETPTKQPLPMGETENAKPFFGDIMPPPGSEIYDPSAQFLLEQREAEQAQSLWDPDSWSDSESEQAPPPPPKQATVKGTTGGKKEAGRTPATTASVGQSSTKGLVEDVPASANTPETPLTANVQQAAPAVATQEPESLDFSDNKSAFTTYRFAPMENKKRPGTEPFHDQPSKRPRTDLHED